MADEAAEIARIVAEQRATPEDLKPQPDALIVPAPIIETAPEAVAAEGEAEASADGDVAPAPAEADTPAPKAKKTPTDYLTGRIGNLNQRLTERETALAAALARAEAAERLLNARGTPAPDGSETPPASAPARTDTNPNTGRSYTPEEFQAAVAQQAARQAFNAQADEVYNTGKGSFPDWDQTVQVLNASGLMSEGLLEAALAVGDQKTSAAVFHYLGSDLEEAQRIGQLSGPRLGVELARIAAQVSTPTPAARVSSAPAPIPTIRGGVAPSIDYAKLTEGDSNDMSAFVAARKKAGDPFAMSRKERSVMARGS